MQVPCEVDVLGTGYCESENGTVLNGGECMEWVNVATFNEAAPAEALVKRCNQGGIPARIHDEDRLL